MAITFTEGIGKMKDYLNCCFLVFLILIPINSSAQLLKFDCSGSLYSISPTPFQLSFELSVSTDPAEIFDYPIRIALGCASQFGSEPKMQCKSSVSKVECECEHATIRSTLSISRYTGRLETTSISKNDNTVWRGQFQCRPLTNKIF
jgi:hypothetical protein